MGHTMVPGSVKHPVSKLEWSIMRWKKWASEWWLYAVSAAEDIFTARTRSGLETITSLFIKACPDRIAEPRAA